MENRDGKLFEIEKEGKTFSFSLDKHGIVWLLDSKNGNSNYGQERPVTSLEEAKEMAVLMLYAMGRIKRP
jgi:hypothetical protein